MVLTTLKIIPKRSSFSKNSQTDLLFSSLSPDAKVRARKSGILGSQFLVARCLMSQILKLSHVPDNLSVFEIPDD